MIMKNKKNIRCKILNKFVAPKSMLVSLLSFPNFLGNLFVQIQF